MHSPLSESMQAYATRTGRSVVDAYPQWHAHGYGPRSFTSVDGPVVVEFNSAGYGPGLGLTQGDVRALDRAAKQRVTEWRR